MDILHEVAVSFKQTSDGQSIGISPGYFLQRGFYDYYTDDTPGKSPYNGPYQIIPRPPYQDDPGIVYPYVVGNFPSDASIVMVAIGPESGNLEIYRDGVLWASDNSGQEIAQGSGFYLFTARCVLYAPGPGA